MTARAALPESKQSASAAVGPSINWASRLKLLVLTHALLSIGGIAEYRVHVNLLWLPAATAISSILISPRGISPGGRHRKTDWHLAILGRRLALTARGSKLTD